MAQHRLGAEERSRAIVAATRLLFARQGFDSTTTRQIARAARVSEALVFKYFPHKKDLYRAIIEERMADADRSLPLDETLTALDDPAFFERIAVDVLRRVEADDSFLRLLLRSALEGHELADEFHRARVERVLKLLEDRLRQRYAREGRGGRLAPAMAARVFHGMIFGTLLSRNIFSEPLLAKAPAERVARSLVQVFLHGLDPVGADA